MLINLYVEQVFSETLHDILIGIKINGRAVNNIRYADDTVLIAGNMHDLQIILDRVNARGQETDLKVNVGKTKLLIVSREELESATM